MNLKRFDIERLLPQREPFLMVDEVVSYSASKIEAMLRLESSLPFFRGHFPNNPIMPGVLMTEALAQTSGLLLALNECGGDIATHSPKLFYLASVNMKYLSVARAGDALRLCSAKTRIFSGLAQFDVSAFVDSRECARGTIVLAEAGSVK